MEIRTEPRTAIRVICHDSAMRNSAKTMIEHKLMMIRTKLVCAPAISHDSVLRISNNSSLIALSNEINTRRRDIVDEVRFERFHLSYCLVTIQSDHRSAQEFLAQRSTGRS